MRFFITAAAIITLSGCAYLGPKDYAQYVETAKSLSKDSAMTQAACFSATAEIAKGGDASAKVAAIALAEKCKNPAFTVEAPKRNWLGF